MDDVLFELPPCGGHGKILDEMAEPDDVDQLMDEKVNQEGVEWDIGLGSHLTQDGVVLEADHVQIKLSGRPGIKGRRPFVADNLGKNRLRCVLPWGEVDPRLDVVPVSKPLAFRDFIMVAYQALGDRGGPADQTQFIGCEMGSLHGLLEKMVDTMGVMVLISCFV